MKKMKVRRASALLGVGILALGFCGSSAQAGLIIGQTNVGGTGGTSTLATTANPPAADDANPALTNIGGTTTFTGPGFIDTTFTVFNNGSAFEYRVDNAVSFAPGLNYYTVLLGQGTGAGFTQGGIPDLNFDFNGNVPENTPPPSSSNPAFTLVTQLPTELSWFAHPASNGTFTFAIDVPDFGSPAPFYSFTLRQVAATPEPGTYAMFAIGLVGLAFVVRRKKKGEAATPALA